MNAIKKIAARAFLVSAGVVFYAKSSWAILPIEHWTQPNGAQVWLVQSPTLPMVDVQIDFDAGSRRDPADKAGLASAAANLLTKGVRQVGEAPAIDENALGEAWADLGALFNAGADRDALSISLRSLTDPALLERAATLMSRQIGQPAWPAEVWQRERARWSASILESDTRPGTVSGKAFAKAVYGDHPYGQRATPETLERIDIADMRAYAERNLLACRAKVSIVGAVSRAQAQSLVETLLTHVPAGENCAPLPSVPAVEPLQKAEEVALPFASAQAYVLIGQPGFERSDPDFLALLVGNHILGGGGFTSLLTHEVREKRGLSYSVSSGFSPGLNAGAFVIGFQTRPDQAAEALKVSRDVLTQFIAKGPTKVQLQAAKDNLIGSFPLRIDSNSKLLGNLVNIATNGLPLDYLEGWTVRVAALTAEDVRTAMAKTLQPDRMATVVLGAKP